ncbi:MAG: Cell division protein FtsQ, partial [Verrucomicrobiota bacterium]
MFNFFKGKPRNRRLHGGAVLDVKLRSDQVRTTRMRMLAVSLGLAFGTFFCVFLLWRTGNWLARKLVTENAAFAITQIDASTDGVISPEQIRRWAGIQTGANLMALKLEDVKKNLEVVPYFRTVSVERVLPHTLRIHVMEREAVAQATRMRPRQGGGFDAEAVNLDVEGSIFVPLDARFRSAPIPAGEPALPAITGISPNEFWNKSGHIESEQGLAALQLIQTFSESAMAAIADIKRVDVGSPEVLVVTTTRGGEITFSLRDFDRQLLRWREIQDRSLRYNKVIAALDLAVTNNTPVR